MHLSLWTKRLVIMLGFGLGLLFLALVTFSLLLRLPFIQDELKARIRSNIVAKFGREVRIGSVRLDPLLRSLKIQNLTVSPHGQLDADPLLLVKGAELYLNPWELLRLRLRLTRVLLHGPKVRIQPLRLKAPAQPLKPLTAIPLSLPLGIAHLEVRDGEMIWDEEGKRVTLAGLQGDIRLHAGQAEGSVDIAETKIEVGKMSLLVTDFGMGARIQGEDLQVHRLRLTTMGSLIEGKGLLEGLLNEPAFHLDLNARGEVEDLFPQKPPVPLSGKFRVKGKLAGTVKNPVFTGHAEVAQGRVEQLQIVGMNLKVDGNRDGLRLTQLVVQGADGTLNGDMSVTWKSLQYRINLLGKEVDLTQILRPIVERATVGGRTALEAHVVGQGKDLSKLKGHVKVGVEGFHFLNHPEDRGHVRIFLHGRGDRLHIQELHATLAQTLLKADGTLEAAEQLKMRVTAQTTKLEQIAGLFGSKPQQLAGEAEFKGQLKGSLADPVIQGDLLWTKAKLLGVTLNRVQGPVELAMAQRTLKSPAVDAKGQDLHGKFAVALTLLPKPPDRKIKLKEDLELRIDGHVEGAWKSFVAMFLKKAALESLPIAGTMQLKAGIRGFANQLTAEGKLVLTEGHILAIPYVRSDATVHLENRKVFLREIKIQQRNGALMGNYEVGFDGYTRWNFTSTPISLGGFAFLGNTGVSGAAEILHASGEGPLGLENATSEVKFTDLSYGTENFGRGEGTITWDGSQQRSTGKLVLPERGYSFQGSLLTEADFPFNGILTLKGGDLGPILRLFRENLPAQLSGIGTGQINVTARIKQRVFDSVILDLQTAKLEIQGYSFQTAGKTKLTFKDGQLTIFPLTLKGEGANIALNGSIAKELDLTIRGTVPTVLGTMVTPEISMASGLTHWDMVVQGPRGLPRYRGRVHTKGSSLALRGHPEPLENLRGEIRFTDSSAMSTGLEAQWAGGTLRATLGGKREQEGWKWPVEFKLENARVERVLVSKNHQQLPGRATGDLQASGVFNITTAPGRPWLPLLKGTIKAKIVDGVVLRSFVLEKILTAINIMGLFRKGPGGKGMPYDEMSATFLLENGIARTENLLLRSPSIRGGGTGQIDMVRRTCDAHVAIQPLQLTDRVIRGVSKLPLIKQLGVGTLLFGKDKSVLVVAYRVHGPLDSLQLDHVPTRAVDRGVMGIFEKTLGLPANLLLRSIQKSE